MRPSAADELSDDEMLDRFLRCDLPHESWTHRSHLRVAYMLLTRHGLVEAIDRMRAGIQRFNAFHHVPEAIDAGYHETITQAWLRIIHRIIQAHGRDEGAAAFIERHAYLDNKFLLRLFYTRERIMTARAKREYVEPDVARFE